MFLSRLAIALLLAPCACADPKPVPALRETTGLMTTTPVTQSRDKQYDWLPRHQKVLEQNKNAPPEIILIGDSITHLWGGPPTVGYAGAGPDAWKKTFGKRAVTNSPPLTPTLRSTPTATPARHPQKQFPSRPLRRSVSCPLPAASSDHRPADYP